MTSSFLDSIAGIHAIRVAWLAIDDPVLQGAFGVGWVQFCGTVKRRNLPQPAGSKREVVGG